MVWNSHRPHYYHGRTLTHLQAERYCKTQMNGTLCTGEELLKYRTCAPPKKSETIEQTDIWSWINLTESDMVELFYNATDAWSYQPEFWKKYGPNTTTPMDGLVSVWGWWGG